MFTILQMAVSNSFFQCCIVIEILVTLVDNNPLKMGQSAL